LVAASLQREPRHGHTTARRPLAAFDSCRAAEARLILRIVVVHIRFVNLSTRDAPNRRSQPMRATHQRHYPKQASRTMRKANPLAGLDQ